MTPGVLTCTSCGKSARPGSRFCPACASPLTTDLTRDAAQAPNAGIPGYTNAWDTVLPRLQEALYGEFVISRELGRGGMAAVFLAHQLRLNRKVAIKVMAPTLMSGLGLVDRFRDEATTVARLDHPNIISIYEIGETGGLQYFVMQYVTGRSLERALRQFSQLPIDVVRGIVFDIGSALAYAHRNDVIHRDVKPGNILLSLDGRVMVSDFGIAKVTASTARTQTGAVVGTPGYMSPEQCLGRLLTWSADQYSLGVVAYEMVTGVQPFVGSSFVVMRGHIEERPPSVLARRPDCPRDVAAAIERMLAKNAADRFPSMGEALNALGATRARISDAVQAAVGQLAIPLPDETGLVLVHTPASPVPARTPAQPTAVDPMPAKAPAAAHALQETSATAPAAPPVTPPEPPPGPRFQRLRAVAGDALGRCRAAGAWTLITLGKARAMAWAFAAWLIAAAAKGFARARGSRAAIGGTGAVALLAVAVLVVRLAGHPAATERKPGAVVAESALGATVKDASPDTTANVPADTLADSVTADTFVPRDSSDASVVKIIPGSMTAPTDGRLQLGVVVRDFRGNRVRNANVRWSVADERIATVDSLAGWVGGRVAGKKTWIIARAGYGADSVLITVVKPPSRTVATTTLVDTTNKPAEPTPPAFDEPAEANAVQASFDALLDSLEARDTSFVNDKYFRSADQDFDSRAALIKALLRTGDLAVAPPQNPPQPAFTGTTLASMQGRIAFTWTKSRRSRDRQNYIIEAEFRRVGSIWAINRFRLSATK